MNCNECSNLLDDYIEEELDTKNLVLMETHLASCANCARSYQGLKAEQNLYAHYLTNVEATPQLWSGLQEKLEKARSPIYRQPLAYFQNLFANNFRGFYPNQLQVTALTIIAVLGVIGFVKYKFADSQSEQNYAADQEKSVNANPTPKNEIVKLNNKADDDLREEQTFTVKQNQSDTAENRRRKNTLPVVSVKRTNQVTASKITNSTRKQPTDEVVRKVERQYVNAIAVLTRDIERRRDKLSANALSQAETVLTDLNRTIENTRRAVREEPQNPVAVQYMTAAYAKKIEMLRAMTKN